MLLVDDDEAEAVELDFFFDQRVGADDQLRLAAVDEAAGVALAVFVERAGQQHDAIVAGGALQQLARGQKMLRGENLGGRHERGLVAVFHGHEHGLQGDDGLARADIALQQAAHGAGVAHVGHDFAQRALLRGGGMEGQDLADGFADFVGWRSKPMPARSLMRRRFSSRPSSRKKSSSKIRRRWAGVDGALQLGKGRAFGREMDLAQSGFAVGQIEAGQHLAWQALGNGAAHGLEEIEDDLALPA